MAVRKRQGRVLIPTGHKPNGHDPTGQTVDGLRGGERIVLMVRDARSLYVYWRLAPTTAVAIEAPTAAAPAVRLRDVTDHRRSASGRAPTSTSYVEYACEPNTSDGYLPDAVPGRLYRAELGYRDATGRWQPVLRSNVVRTPLNRPAHAVDDHCATLQWEDELGSFAARLSAPTPIAEYDEPGGLWVKTIDAQAVSVPTEVEPSLGVKTPAEEQVESTAAAQAEVGTRLERESQSKGDAHKQVETYLPQARQGPPPAAPQAQQGPPPGAAEHRTEHAINKLAFARDLHLPPAVVLVPSPRASRERGEDPRERGEDMPRQQLDAGTTTEVASNQRPSVSGESHAGDTGPQPHGQATVAATYEQRLANGAADTDATDAGHGQDRPPLDRVRVLKPLPRAQDNQRAHSSSAVRQKDSQ